MSDDQFDTLITQLQDPQKRENTLLELGNLGDARAVEPIGQLLLQQEDDPLAYRVRGAAADALARLGDARALMYLRPALDDASVIVRLRVVYALATLNDERALAALVERLHDPKPEVRAAIAQALGTLGAGHDINIKPVAVLLADPEDSVRQAATEALFTMGAKSVDELLLALKSDNSTVRGAAADLLGRLGDQRAIDALTNTYYTDRSKWVRSRAKLALDQFAGGFIPDPDKEESLDPLRDGPRIASPQDTIKLIRKQTTIDWPTLGKEPMLPDQRDAQPRESSNPDISATMDAAAIQAMLDQLDVRLAQGEISEATYKNLYARWEARLRDAKDQD